jgi:hypothetical protein
MGTSFSPKSTILNVVIAVKINASTVPGIMVNLKHPMIFPKIDEITNLQPPIFDLRFYMLSPFTFRFHFSAFALHLLPFTSVPAFSLSPFPSSRISS